MGLAAVATSIASFVLKEWESLYKLLYRLYSIFKRGRTDAMFRILDYELTFELLDAKGREAKVHCRQKIEFLQDHAIAIEDFVWGAGDQLVDYQFSPGKVVDIVPEGDRQNILISLEETKSKGDIVEFHITRTIRNGFKLGTEWIQTEIWKEFLQIRMNIIFPSDRPYNRAVLKERSRNKTTVLDHEHRIHQTDGRQTLVWEQKHPRQGEIYTIEWEW